MRVPQAGEAGLTVREIVFMARWMFHSGNEKKAVVAHGKRTIWKIHQSSQLRAGNIRYGIATAMPFLPTSPAASGQVLSRRKGICPNLL